MLVLPPAFAADPDPLLRPEDRTAVLQALAAGDMTIADLSFEKDVLQSDGFRRDRWRLPGIEALLHAPMDVPADAAKWSGVLTAAKGDAGTVFDGLVPAWGIANVRYPIPRQQPCVVNAPRQALRKLDPAVRRAACRLVENRAFYHERTRDPREMETLLAMLAPDGEDAWDATEGPARTRSLLASFEGVADVAVEAHLAPFDMAQVERTLVDVKTWPDERLDLVVNGIPIQIGSPGSDTFTAALTLDPGGDDLYRLEAAPLDMHLDLDGNDTWTGGDGTLGGTIGGVSIVIDASGNDTWRGGRASLGAGVLGVGILVDRDGDDTYRGTTTTQGAGFAGMGMLLDGKGSDTYDAQAYAQGYANTQGIGALWDGEGDDMYRAGGTFPDMPTRLPEHTLSLSQGFSIGMRPDAGGGLGLLVDDAGNDAYVADLFAQGCSYWFSRGYLIDRAGNDRYGMYQYGQGSGIHLSVGGLFDLAGNDAYTGGNIVQGSSHDLSVGWLVDRTGDDIYAANSTAQAGSLTNSATFFLDAAGDDAYLFRLPFSRGQGRFDRNRGSIGVFVDVTGTDKYDGVPGDGGVARPWPYGVVVDDVSKLPPPDPEVALPKQRELRDPPSRKDDRPPATPEALADLAKGDSVDCKTPPSCEQYRAELAKGGPDVFARLLPALPRDNLAEQYTIDAVMRAIRSPDNDPKLRAIILDHLAAGPSYAAERWAIRWLGDLGVDPAGTVAALTPLAHDPDPLLREAVAGAILALKVAPPLLDELAKDPEVGVRAVAALALGAGGADPARITPLLSDSNVLVRFDAAKALLGLPADKVRPALATVWKGSFPTPASRRLVLELLMKVGGNDAIVRAVAAGDADPWAVRKAKGLDAAAEW